MNTIKLFLSLLTKKVSSSFLKSVSSIFSSELQKLIVKVLPEVTKIVVELATKNEIPNNLKQRAAFGQVADLLKKEGIEASTSFINLVIELAVAQLKNQK